MESPSEKVRGGGGFEATQIKLCSERLLPEVQSLTLTYTIFAKGTPFVYLPFKSCTLFINLLHENKSARKEVIFVLPLTELTCKRYRHKTCFFEAFQQMKDFPLLWHTSTFDFPTLCYAWCLKEVPFGRSLPDYENCIMKSWTGDELTFGHGRWLKTDAIIDDTIKSPKKR